MSEQDQADIRLEHARIKQEHADFDTAINAMIAQGCDPLTIQRMKKKKLVLKDRLADVELDINAIAAHVHLSRRTFDRRFRMQTGLSPLQWVLQQRVLRAQHLLETTTLHIDAVARRCGFSDAVALRPHFRRLVGVPPQAYRATFRAA